MSPANNTKEIKELLIALKQKIERIEELIKESADSENNGVIFRSIEIKTIYDDKFKLLIGEINSLGKIRQGLQEKNTQENNLLYNNLNSIIELIGGFLAKPNKMDSYVTKMKFTALEGEFLDLANLIESMRTQINQTLQLTKEGRQKAEVPIGGGVIKFLKAIFG